MFVSYVLGKQRVVRRVPETDPTIPATGYQVGTPWCWLALPRIQEDQPSDDEIILFWKKGKIFMNVYEEYK